MKLHLFPFIAFFILLNTSCSEKAQYENASLFYYNDFSETQALKGSRLEFDDIVLKPTKLYTHNSLLITYNSKEEKLFHSFSLNSHKKLNECISMGQGPNEMIQPYFVENNEGLIILFDMATSKINKYKTEDFVSNLDPQPIHQIQLKEQVLSEIALLSDQTIIGSPWQPESPFFLFDKKGDKIKNIGAYPVGTNSYSDIEKLDAYQSIITTNLADKIAVCYIWTDLIDIYNKEGKLEKRIHGPEHFSTQFKEFSDGRVITSRPVAESQRDAYYSPVSVGEYFFVLYNGKHISDKEYSLLSKQILVFDWNGIPQKRLLLDQGIFTMTVDAKNKKIYGISDYPEFHFLEFEYD